MKQTKAVLKDRTNIMVKNIIILILFVCFSAAIIAGQSSSHIPPKFPVRKPGMTKEEYHKETQKFFEQQRRQKQERNREHINLMSKQAWLRLLRVSEQKWKIIEPKYREANDLEWEIWTGAKGWDGRDEQDFHWFRRSKGDGFRAAMTLDEMNECERIVEALTDLLEDENSKDEQIRKKIDELQQVRENARKALPLAKKELAKVLTNTRQEAIFLIMGYID
jgi:hypothetical protein